MRRTILLVAAMAAALLMAGSVVLFSGLGRDGPPVAQAQTTSEGQDDSLRQGSSRAEGAAGRAVERGVSMRPETDGSQAQAVPQRAVEPPPLGLTERGKAALREARQGNAQPAQRPTVDAGATPSSPSTNEPENNDPQPDTPALGTSFLGVADTGSFPPDSQIAAGPNNIVASTNGAVNILDKRGNSLSSQTLRGFFSPLGAEHNDVFDPWVVYDPYINRFWIIAVSGRTTQFSNIVIGLSDTQDATLGWRLWELDATVDGATDTQNWCDYPKLGFDAQAIYVTCNMFQLNTTTNANNFQYSKTRIMTKSQFVNNTGIFWWDTTQLREGNVSTGSFVFTLQPAQMFGASASDGEFLVDAQGRGGTGSALDVWRISNAAECCNGDNVGPTLAYRSHGVGSYGPSDGARQSGSATQINNGDSRLLYAVWKNGRLSTGHTVACPGTPTNACGGFTELNVSGYPTISTLRNWALTAGGEDVYFPAVSVNGADDKTMVFSVSDSSRFASAAYVGIPSITDCPGNPTCLDGGTTLIRSGQNSYVRLDTQNRNRWGDYSGAAADPNGEGIWVAGEFAAATANTWGVQAGLTYQTAPPPANDPFNGSQFISGTSILANGTNRYATWQPGEPGSNSTTHSVWYRWTAPFSGPVTMNTCNSSFDTVLAVYTGFAVNSLTQVASDDDACTSPNASGSQLTFNAAAGTTYRIAVRGFLGREGTFTFGLKMPPQNDNFANAQTVSGGNATVNGTTLAATREPGEPDHSTDTDGASWLGDHSVWYSWTAPSSGSTTMDTCTSNIDSILAIYTGSSLGGLSRIADNNNACPSGWGSRVAFNAVAGTTYRIAVGDAGGLRENTFTLRVADSSAPETTITSGPSGQTNDNTPTFSFSGSDNATPSSNLLFSYKVDSGAWSAYQSSTSATLGGTTGLSNGSHTFYVKAKDAAGNEDATPAERSFTVDTIKPRAKRVVPAENATGIAPGTNVSAFFSEAMRAGSINKNTVKLFRAGTTTAIGATVTYDAANKRAILNPNTNLRRGVKYKAVVTTGVRDLAGNQLDQNPTVSGNQPKQWFFTIRN